jgi:indolepyruvate ferredoxin oxidoreductase beta subunit
MRTNAFRLPLAAAGEATERPISIAVVAMGGQGGGVLTGWIVKLAENAGWVAQSTSIPGVAQRTGATIYYVEMMQAVDGRLPILAQMPTPGDVDIVLASEFMEAGRSILRGIVTPDRTTLIASSHRSFAIGEKTAPGDAIAHSPSVTEAIDVTAKRSIVFDMDALAIDNGSVISAAMFGALAGSGALHFDRRAYHAVIEGDGKGVSASLKTFDAAFERAVAGPPQSEVADASATPALPSAAVDPRLRPLLERVDVLPDVARSITHAGLAKVVDYQDARYGAEYLDLLEDMHALDVALDGRAHGYRFTVDAAKYLANAMTYDDVIRVADLKTRAPRRHRIEREMGLRDDQILQTTEFMHPRLEEIAGMLPARVGRWLGANPKLYAWLDRRVSKGRRVKTYSLAWFLPLYLLSGLRGLRRGSLRHAVEVAHRDRWRSYAMEQVRQNYDLGVEILKCRRLVKGYSDTHARGLSKFDRVLSEIRRIEDRPDAADWARRLCESAVRDAEGDALAGLIGTMQSFA